VSWHETTRGLFEIDGVPAGALREFSRRRVEIEERAEQLTGVTASELSRERRQGIALATRMAKTYGVDGIRWQDEARARAAEHGLGPAELSELVTRQAGQASRATAVDGIAGAFEQGASMSEIRAAVDLYLQDGSDVPLGSVDHEARFTPRGLLACEGAIVATAERRLTENAGVLPTTGWSEPRAGQSLNADQLAAAQTLTGDGQGISVVQALAGTGRRDYWPRWRAHIRSTDSTSWESLRPAGPPASWGTPRALLRSPCTGSSPTAMRWLTCLTGRWSCLMRRGPLPPGRPPRCWMPRHAPAPR
jgi:hypothetical protein